MNTTAISIDTGALPAATSSLSRVAVFGWASSTATHVAIVAAAITWAMYGPELPTLGGTAGNEPVTLTVALSEPEPTESLTFEVEAIPARPVATAVKPQVEQVEHRDPTKMIDDTHRRFVVEDAPAAASPPNMIRDAHHAEETIVPPAAHRSQSTQTRKVRVASPTIVAKTARRPSLRITRNASPVDNPLPMHPPEAIARNLSGTVVLRLHIDASGHVHKAEVHQSSGHTILDRAAASHALAHWSFHPARAGRRPVAQVIRVPVVFL